MASRLAPISADDRMVREATVMLRKGQARVIPLYDGLFLVASQSRPGEWHTVSTGDRPGCTCESWQARSECGHVAAVQELATSESVIMRDNAEIFTDLAATLDVALIRRRKVGGGAMKPYIRAFDAVDQANRIFGYDGWSYDVVNVEARTQQRTNTQTGEVTEAVQMWIATVAVTIPAWNVKRTDVGVGVPKDQTAEQQDMASKTAITDAMKRALRTFGAQFGNELYDPDFDDDLDEENIPARQHPAAGPAANNGRPAQSAPAARQQAPAPQGNTQRQQQAPAAAPSQAAQGQPAAAPSKPMCPIHNVVTRANMSNTGLGHDIGVPPARGWCDLGTACSSAYAELLATYQLTGATIDTVLRKHPRYGKPWADLSPTQRALALPGLGEWAAKTKAAGAQASADAAEAAATQGALVPQDAPAPVEEPAPVQEPAPEQQKPTQPANAAATPPRRTSAPGDAATPAQVNAIYSVARREYQWDQDAADAKAREAYGKPVGELSKREASELLDKLKMPVGAA